MPARKDLTGHTFGRLYVAEYIPRRTGKSISGALYKCLCVCGGTVERTSSQLNSGQTYHCGCLRGQRISIGKTKHGESNGKTRAGTARYRMWKAAAQRAKAKGLEFTIGLTDITVPEYCPVLGLKLESGKGVAHPASPSLDRIDNTKGYVPGNVAVISKRANNIKSDASVEDLFKVYSWLSKAIEKSK